ncbi:hypothetical protein GE09DRAFT_1145937 [Coniochaeta sp. 2T2.1]|nr:hypothetical protein GE09DRAFT_1145937 [Coniochaeta sp. 2T2.1]
MLMLTTTLYPCHGCWSQLPDVAMCFCWEIDTAATEKCEMITLLKSRGKPNGSHHTSISLGARSCLSSGSQTGHNRKGW